MNSLADAAVILSESASRDYVTFKYVELVVMTITLLAFIALPLLALWRYIVWDERKRKEKRNGTP